MKKVRFTLPCPEDLNEWLQEQAAIYNRSRNQHIIYLLQAIRQTSKANKQRLSEIDNLFIEAENDTNSELPEDKWM